MVIYIIISLQRRVHLRNLIFVARLVENFSQIRVRKSMCHKPVCVCVPALQIQSHQIVIDSVVSDIGVGHCI